MCTSLGYSFLHSSETAFLTRSLLMTIQAFADSVDQDQTTQKVQSDL